MKFSKIILSIIILSNIIFTSTVLVIFINVGSEPVALIGAWFAFTTCEIWLLAGIKKCKIKKGGEYNDKLETEADE